MSRLIFLLALAAAGCASTKDAHHGALVPCTDDDVERCLGYLLFLENVASKDEKLKEALERYCVNSGSMEACRALADMRRDSSLETLCSEGIAEACPVPAKPTTPEKLAQDCKARVPNSCRELATRTPDENAVWRDASVLEAVCADGIAQACFLLSQSLRAGNDPSQTARANTLAWRACLAGVRPACLISDKATARCENGNASACRQLRPLPTDSAETVASKMKVLSAGCSRGVLDACLDLQGAPGLTAKRGVELACQIHPECPGAPIGNLSLLELDEYCASNHRIKRNACMMRLNRRSHDSDQAKAGINTASAVVEKLCGEGDIDACEELSSWLDREERGYDSLRIACRAKLKSCDEKDRAGLEKLTACTEKAEPATCLTAGLWARGRYDLRNEHTILLGALGAACKGGEAVGCLEAATVLEDSIEVSTRLEFLRSACKMKSAEACAEAVPLEADKRACDAGHCEAWASRHLKASPGHVPALEWLENACRKGDKPSCERWRAAMANRLVQRLNRCPTVPGLCTNEDKAARSSLAQCQSGSAKHCLALLEQFENSGRAEEVINEPEALKWATAACSTGTARGCAFQAGLSKTDVARLPPAEKACALGDAYWCAGAAELIWDIFEAGHDEKSTQAPNDAPEAKKAFSLAMKSCELGHGPGCDLAATWSAAGRGVPADEAAAARLRQKARDLKQRR